MKEYCPGCGLEVSPPGAWTCVVCGKDLVSAREAAKKKVAKPAPPKPKFTPMRPEEFFAEPKREKFTPMRPEEFFA